MHKVPSDLEIPMATIWAYAWELQVALSALCSEQKTQTKAGVSLWLCALQSGAVQDNYWRVGRNLETPTDTYSLSKRKKDGGLGG